MEIDFTEALRLLVKICKEKEYNELQTAVHNSYIELIKIESGARREKASGLIRGIQAIDRELTVLNFEYDKVKRDFKIDGIPYYDQFITGIKKKRGELAALKNSLR